MRKTIPLCGAAAALVGMALGAGGAHAVLRVQPGAGVEGGSGLGIEGGGGIGVHLACEGSMCAPNPIALVSSSGRQAVVTGEQICDLARGAKTTLTVSLAQGGAAGTWTGSAPNVCGTGVSAHILGLWGVRLSSSRGRFHPGPAAGVATYTTHVRGSSETRTWKGTITLASARR